MSTNVTRRSDQNFDFSRAEQIVDVARRNNLAVGGGYLVVHGTEPPWITASTDRQIALAEMQLDVTTTMKHFAGQLDHWVIVNEAIDPSHGDQDGLRRCAWLSAIAGEISAGTDYVSEAFKAARAAQPTATLVLNDNNMEGDRPEDDRKREAVLRLLRRWRESNVPIDALGIQAHLRSGDNFTSGRLDRFLASISELGIKILITELDVIDVGLSPDISERDSAVAQSIGDFLGVVLRHRGLTSINTWGLSDGQSWYNRSATPPSLRRKDGLPSRGTLFDQQLRAKPSYNAVRAILENGEPVVS